MTDLLKFLILYLDGGVYLDTDIVVVRSLSSLNNTIGREDDRMGAVMVLEENNKFLERCILEFLDSYNATVWAENGPLLLRKIYEKELVDSRYHHAPWNNILKRTD